MKKTTPPKQRTQVAWAILEKGKLVDVKFGKKKNVFLFERYNEKCVRCKITWKI